MSRIAGASLASLASRTSSVGTERTTSAVAFISLFVLNVFRRYKFMQKSCFLNGGKSTGWLTMTTNFAADLRGETRPRPVRSFFWLEVQYNWAFSQFDHTGGKKERTFAWQCLPSKVEDRRSHLCSFLCFLVSSSSTCCCDRRSSTGPARTALRTAHQSCQGRFSSISSFPFLPPSSREESPTPQHLNNPPENHRLRTHSVAAAA